MAGAALAQQMDPKPGSGGPRRPHWWVPSVATTGSRMHLMMGAAVLGAVEKIKDSMTAIASQATGVEPSLIELVDGECVA